MGFVLSFVAVGVVLQVLSRWFPVRVFEDAPEYALDAFALLLALACQLAIPFFAFPWISGVQHYEAVSASYRALMSLPAAASGLLYFVVVDFLAYWFHRLSHSRVLWPTHAFHHSARNIYWASGMRGSPVHFVLLGLPQLLVLVVYSPEGPVATLVTVYGVLHNSLIHSNVRVPTRLLNAVFVTGESHFVHHGRDPRLGNANFGFLLTAWDRLFGTWVDPRSVPRDHALGLGYEVGTARLVLGLPAPADPGSSAGASPSLAS